MASKRVARGDAAGSGLALAAVFDAPAPPVPPAMRTCRPASPRGPSHCQLLGSSSSSAGEQQVSAQLQLRAAPRWLETFRAGVAADAGRLDGRVTGNSIRSEDLTRQVVDTEATMRAPPS